MLNPKTNTSWGTDPEAFFKKNGKIVGSERFIPKRGVLRGRYGRIVRDGVQFEMHPTPSASLPLVGNALGQLFGTLSDILEDNKGVALSFDGLVTVDRAELDSLSKESRILGCMPSHNVYEDRPITVDPLTYPKRSSGGHIHVGLATPELKAQAERLATLCDILVGMPSVLLDRDPGAAERRQNYGRAGECRFPSHGLEYRTTSNFWLRDYSLMSFVFGMANLAVAVLAEALDGNKKPYNAIISAVRIPDIIKTIDTNDFNSALANLNRLVPFFRSHVPDVGFPLSAINIGAFVNFVKTVNKNGINTVFPERNIVRNWQRDNKREFSDFLRER